MMKRAAIVVGVWVGLMLGIPVFGQNVTGSISGSITDSSGGSIAQAQVQVKNNATGLTRQAVTSSDGTYSVPSLTPGMYTVTATRQGFATSVHSQVQLLVNQSLTLDFRLSPSSVEKTVVVTGTPPALNTTSGTVGEVIESKQIVDLPLNGRQFTQLALLTPGAAPKESGQQGAFTVAEGAGGVSPSVNGQRGQQDNYTMDGVLNNATYTNTWAISPPPDAIQEFNVQSHIVDSQFSISSGANINLVTKSGTNDFHGDMWEFLRNDKLDASNFFTNANNKQKPAYKQNQYGLTFGGPVMLPGYNGRKKNTWFYAYWEGFRSRQGSSSYASVPTQAERNGDFSSQLTTNQIGSDCLGRPIFQGQIYNPSTTRLCPGSTTDYVRDPFTNNQIPTSMFDPSSLLYLQKYYPMPNTANPNVNQNLFFSSPIQINNDQWGVKIDHLFKNNDTLFGRFNYTDPTKIRPEGLPTYSGSTVNKAVSIATGYTHMFGPATLLSLHYGYTFTRFGQYDDPAGQSFISATHSDRLFPMRDGIPQAIQIGVDSNMTGISQFAIPLGPQRGHQFSGDLSLVRGNHTISMGGMMYHIHNFDDGFGMSANFARNATSVDGVSSKTGYGIASFMMGLPDNLFGFLGNTASNSSTWWYGGYLQDKWEVSRKLTLQFGMRYDFVAPPHYANNYISALDVNSGQFLIATPFPPAFPFATARPSLFDPHYNGWQPRFGFAYRMTHSTVMRGAFAIFDDHNNTLVQESQDPRIAWPWGYGVSVQGINHGVPTMHFDNLPTASSYFDPTNPLVAFAANPRNKIPYVMEYNYGFEHQFTGSTTASLDYVGSVGRHLFIQPTANTALTPGPGPISARQPFPQYGGTFSNSTNIGSSSYNSLQAKLEKRFTQGLSFMASYTYSKSMDIQSEGQSGSIESIYHLGWDWAPSDFNIPQMLVVNYVYALPFAKHSRLLGGWNWGGILSMYSGSPFSISAGGDIANVGGGSQRAETSCNATQGFSQSINEWFNTSCFSVPAAYTFGNSGRNILRGPAQKTFDMMLYKDFKLSETKTLQFRSDYFNLFNHANFGLPDRNVQSGGFGTIHSAGAPREIQFALKLSF